MLRKFKSVSMLLFLMGISNSTAYAVTDSSVTNVKITQQNGTCVGVIKDGAGETLIGVSVVVILKKKWIAN